MGPGHRRAVGQDRVPSPSHDVLLLQGGRVGGGRGGGFSGGFSGGGWGAWGPDFSGGCLSPTLHLLNESCLCRWPLVSK